MPGERQTTFDGSTLNAKVEEVKTDNHCEKVMGIENGNRIYCDNTAKYFVGVGTKQAYYCGIHIKNVVSGFKK